jgi:hypothetical protein
VEACIKVPLAPAGPWGPGTVETGPVSPASPFGPCGPVGPGTAVPIPVQKEPSHLQTISFTVKSCPTVGVFGKLTAVILYIIPYLSKYTLAKNSSIQ